MNEPLFSHSILRINVVGTSGCGKSTFSKKLAATLQFPYLEIDKMFWGPNWTNLNDEALFKKLETELSVEKWVLDGNYKRTIPVKWKNAQMVIWLDYSFWRVISRVAGRAVRRSITGIELWEGTGNRETFKKMLGKDSIILWSLNTFHTNREEYNMAINDAQNAHIKFVRLTSPAEAEYFLSEILKQKKR